MIFPARPPAYLALAIFAVGGCAEGGSQKDGGAPSEETFDAGAEVRACEVDDDCIDGIACTSERCSTETGLCEVDADDSACELTEQCVVGRGCELRPPCMGDDDCDDGDFCNGAETCDPGIGCQRGAPPACDDGLGCTVDQCDDEANACAHTPNHARCSSGAFCDGEERCVPEDDHADANGCVAGTPVVCDDGIPCTVDSCVEPTGCEYLPDSNA